jgi:hypothetical protein
MRHSHRSRASLESSATRVVRRRSSIATIFSFSAWASSMVGTEPSVGCTTTSNHTINNLAHPNRREHTMGMDASACKSTVET